MKLTVHNLYYARPNPDGWATFDHVGTFLTRELAEAAHQKESSEFPIYYGPRKNCEVDGEPRFPGEGCYEFGVVEVCELDDGKPMDLTAEFEAPNHGQGQIWLCSYVDCNTNEKWDLEITSSPPMAQANAEVSGIRALESTRPNANIQCVQSKFVKEV